MQAYLKSADGEILSSEVIDNGGNGQGADEAAVLTVINPLTASIMGIIFAHELLSPLKIAGYIIILSTLYIYNSRQMP